MNIIDDKLNSSTACSNIFYVVATEEYIFSNDQFLSNKSGDFEGSML